MESPLAQVVNLTERDIENAQVTLADEALELAADLVVLGMSIKRGEAKANIKLSGIVQGRGTTIDGLCARWCSLQMTLERLQWAVDQEGEQK